MTIDNLYQHKDGGFYCLLSDDAPLKNPANDAWVPGVVYMASDGKMRSTTKARWMDRFAPVAEYTGDDEAVMSMIRRANPGSTDFDFVRIFESWHESEVNITGSMLELAVAATVDWFAANLGNGVWDLLTHTELTIKTEDLRRILETYDIEKEAIPHGFIFTIRK